MNWSTIPSQHPIRSLLAGRVASVGNSCWAMVFFALCRNNLRNIHNNTTKTTTTTTSPTTTTTQQQQQQQHNRLFFESRATDWYYGRCCAFKCPVPPIVSCWVVHSGHCFSKANRRFMWPLLFIIKLSFPGFWLVCRPTVGWFEQPADHVS